MFSFLGFQRDGREARKIPSPGPFSFRRSKLGRRQSHLPHRAVSKVTGYRPTRPSSLIPYQRCLWEIQGMNRIFLGLMLGMSFLAGCTSFLTDSEKESQKNNFIDEFSRYFSNKLVYPPTLAALNIEGQATVLFTFDKQGFLTRCEVLDTGSPSDGSANLKRLFGQSVIDVCKVGGFPVAPLLMTGDEGFQAKKTFYFRMREPESGTSESSAPSDLVK